MPLIKVDDEVKAFLELKKRELHKRRGTGSLGDALRDLLYNGNAEFVEIVNSKARKSKEKGR